MMIPDTRSVKTQKSKVVSPDIVNIPADLQNVANAIHKIPVTSADAETETGDCNSSQKPLVYSTTV